MILHADHIFRISTRIRYMIKLSSLQVKILKCLVLKGKQSKSSLSSILKGEHDQPNISNSIDNLKLKKLLKHSGKRYGRGRPEVFYKITQVGLASLIVRESKPTEFWRMIIGLYRYCEENINSSTLEKFYNLFINNYLRYPSIHGFLLQLEPFNKMCLKWIKKSTQTKDISLAQKVIEILAFKTSPRLGLELEELIRMSGESKDNINKVLDSHMMKSIFYTDIYFISEDEDMLERLPEQYQDFLQHSLVVTNYNAKSNIASPTYRLSLFGVLLAMTFVRFHERDKFSLFTNYKTIEEYYDKLASNYEDKLPLIFGQKWHQTLKKYLKLWSVYNFDMILINEETRLKNLERPVIMEGNKEYFQDFHSLALYNNMQMNKIFENGLNVYNDYLRNNQGTNDLTTTVVVKEKLEEIQLLLKCINPEIFQEELNEQQVEKYKRIRLSQSNKEQLKAIPSPIEFLENSFAEEITFMYYLSLLSPVCYSPLFPNYGIESMLSETIPDIANKSSNNSKFKQSYQNIILPSPKEGLLAILNKDVEIRKWFSSRIHELILYHNEAATSMSGFYEKISR